MNNNKENEILRMTIKIMERYKITDAKLAIETAETLYKANIKLDKFQPKYYHSLFDLDEIVNYILKKKEAEEKIISFKNHHLNKTEYTFFPEEPNKTENHIAKIIPYSLKKNNQKRNYY